MAFTGREDHRISLAEARELIRNFRGKAPKGAELGGYFGRGIVEEILAQASVVGIRYYHGHKPGGATATVLVGVDADGNDLWEGTIAEHHWPCPPYCSTRDLPEE